MRLAPWDYLFESFSSRNFPDLFHPTWIASLVLLIVLGILYNVRTRALHRHPPYQDLWEWLWWTGLITFSLVMIGAVFVFDFILVLTTMLVGVGAMVWIRFIRFPPILRAYEVRLARQRSLARQRPSSPDSTIRRRGGGGRRQPRRRRR